MKTVLTKHHDYKAKMKSYHVLHILVRHQYEAEDLLKKIKEGSDFSDLAIKHSSCSSARLGGDLGPLKLGQTDSDFEDAALALKIGQISEKPVRTRFGYHLIKRTA